MSTLITSVSKLPLLRGLVAGTPLEIVQRGAKPCFSGKSLFVGFCLTYSFIILGKCKIRERSWMRNTDVPKFGKSIQIWEKNCTQYLKHIKWPEFIHFQPFRDLNPVHLDLTPKHVPLNLAKLQPSICRLGREAPSVLPFGLQMSKLSFFVLEWPMDKVPWGPTLPFQNAPPPPNTHLSCWVLLFALKMTLLWHTSIHASCESHYIKPSQTTQDASCLTALLQCLVVHWTWL